MDTHDDHWNDFAYFVQQLENHVFATENVKRNDLIEQVGSVSCNRERVQLCLANESLMTLIHSYATTIRSKLEDHGKSDVEAKVLREKADQMFEQDQFADALEAYSAAIAKAQVHRDTLPDSSELTQCLVKRAQVQFVRRKYAFCLRDIEMALQFGYELNDKLVEMQQDCESRLSSNGDQNEPNSDPFVPNNPDLYGGSAKITIKREKGKGRLVVATCDLQFGDRLLVETPFAVLLDAQYYLAFCSHCLKQLDGEGMPCWSCDHALYCSKQCQTTAFDSYHAKECNRTLDLQNDLGVAYMPIRLLNQIGVHYIRSMDWNQIQPPQNHDLESDASTPNRATNDYSSLLSLMTHEHEMDNELMTQYVLTAILIQSLLVDLKVLGFESADDTLKVCSLILLHLQQMHSNLVAVTNHVLLEQFSKEGLEGGEQMTIGIGLYSALSLFNHSCQPNVLSVFSGSQVQISAARNVKAGDELFFCYGPSVQSATRRDRRQALKQQYFFECHCSACESGVESRSRALICQKCNGPVLEHSDRSNQCLNCGLTDQPIDHERLDKAIEQLQKGRQLMQSEQHYKALQFVQDAYAELRELLHRHNAELRKCLEHLYECYAMIGYFDIACSYCEIVLKITREVFGPNSVEVGNERVKLASLRWRVIEKLGPAEAVEAKARSEELIGDIGDIINQFEQLQVKVKERLTEKHHQHFQQFDEIEILNELKEKATLKLK